MCIYKNIHMYMYIYRQINVYIYKYIYIHIAPMRPAHNARLVRWIGACGHYLCMISCLLYDGDAHLMRPFRKEEKSGVLPRLRKGGVAPPSRYMCIYTSSSGVLPRLRRRGVAPRSKYMCMHILLLRIYSFDLSASFLPWRSLCGHQYRPAYLPHIDPPYVLICICIYIYIYICLCALNAR